MNVAASMLVCLNARRQSSELLANAIIASEVKTKTRAGFIPQSLKFLHPSWNRKRANRAGIYLHWAVTRIVSLLPAATEIAAALGLMDHVVGVSHECDFPDEAKTRPRVTHCTIHNAGLTSGEVDDWVKRALHDNGTIYTIDESLLRDLRPDVILTQKLCDVCAVGYGTVARLAATLPGPPQVVNLEPTSLADIFDDIRRVANVCDVPKRADEVIAKLCARVEAVRERASHIASSATMFSDGMGRSAVLFRALGTGVG